MKQLKIGLAITFSFLAGTSLQFLPSTTSVAQGIKSYSDPEKIIVRMLGSSRSNERPEESKLFRITAENNVLNPIFTVPKGKKLIVTDLMFDARHATQDVVINLNQRIEDKSSHNFGKSHYLQQVNLRAGESKEINLCTGYVIHAGNGIVAWTQAGLQPNQIVQMSFTGYLVDELASVW
ncbi:MAG: hypothetical protein IPM25_16220 [Chloracidobacterium sp.]|nr:hypothetical protein [Chloracidobacterium sp.]